MRILLSILGGFLVLMGVIWILQGVNLLPGSSMTGHVEWAVYGAVAVLVGLVAVWWANRRGRR